MRRGAPGGSPACRASRRSRCAGSRCWPCWSRRRRRRAASTSTTGQLVPGQLAGDRGADHAGADDEHVDRVPAGLGRGPGASGHRPRCQDQLEPRPRSRPAARPPRPARSRGSHHDLRLRGPDRLGQAGRLPGAQPGQRGHAQRGRVRRPGHLDRELQQVGLGLHQQPRPGQPAVDAQRGQRAGRGRRPTAPASSATDAAMPVEHARGPGAPRRCPGSARGTRRGRPAATAARRGRPARARTARRRCRAPCRRRASRSAAAGDHAELGQPAHRRRRPCRPGRRGSSRPCPPAARRPRRTGPRLELHRPAARWWRAGTRRCRRCTWPAPAAQAALGEQRRLLVDGQPGHRHRRRRTPWSRRPPRRSPTTAGSAAGVRPNTSQASLRPVGARPGRAACVRDAVAASVTYPAPSRCQQPGVGGGDHAVGGEVLAQPGHLGRGEVRVERQPGDRGQAARPCPASRGADAGRAPVLPDDGRGERPPGPPVPGQHGLALVGQAPPRRPGARAAARACRPAAEHRAAAARPGRPPRRRRRWPRAAPAPRRSRAPAARDRRAAPWWPTCPGRWRGCSPAQRHRSGPVHVRRSARVPARASAPARPPRCASPRARSATGPGRRPGPRRAPRARSTERPGTRSGPIRTTSS